MTNNNMLNQIRQTAKTVFASVVRSKAAAAVLALSLAGGQMEANSRLNQNQNSNGGARNTSSMNRQASNKGAAANNRQGAAANKAGGNAMNKPGNPAAKPPSKPASAPPMKPNTPPVKPNTPPNKPTTPPNKPVVPPNKPSIPPPTKPQGPFSKGYPQGGDVLRRKAGEPQGGDVLRRKAGDPRGGDVIHARNHHIPETHFKTHFGSEHVFHVSRTVLVGSSHVITFGGVRFRCDYPIPVGWVETDPVYIDVVGSTYYLCNRLHPAARVVVAVDQCEACAAAAAPAPCESCEQPAETPAAPCDTCGGTPTVIRGMTIAQTVAILGSPKDIVDLGIRRIYLYDNLKVSFFGGRVSDVR